MKLTETAVAALKLAPDQKDVIHFDDAIPGLGIRLRRSGAKTWLYQYKLAGRNETFHYRRCIRHQGRQGP